MSTSVLQFWIYYCNGDQSCVTLLSCCASACIYNNNNSKGQSEDECLRRVRRVLQSKLNGGNTIGAINTWAVSVVQYIAGIINWRKDELEAVDRKTKKN